MPGVRQPAPGGGVDYAQAWARLQAYVTTKSQHGQVGLLLEMAKIAEDCQVPAGHETRGEAGASVGDAVVDGTDGSPTVIRRGGDDGSRDNGRSCAAAA